MHPSVEDAVWEAIAVLVAEDHLYFRLTANFQESLPAVLIRAEQPSAGDVLATSRLQIEIYHQTRNDAKTLARVLDAHLLSGPHDTSHGLLDRIWADTPPNEVPYYDGQISQFNAVYRVDTRAV
ncbi:hypothetical protein LWF01_02970 [Saxibacter everestensis]|uniref:DUF3168 domain-containing protein n=1 Tax=Saxibacter everestensis TaxID=2909229 RepID=A0ABY8QWG2_9MICO|nr:hypothetical protein LWF01_02970 [Brevibacteriaceae bacterium ZFBP1038]